MDEVTRRLLEDIAKLPPKYGVFKANPRKQKKIPKRKPSPSRKYLEMLEEKLVQDEKKEVLDEEEPKSEIMEQETLAAHTLRYNNFMNDYLNSSTDTNGVSNNGNTYGSNESKTRVFEWGEEVINYDERKETVRAIQMNAIMGGEHNYASPKMKEKYKFWKFSSKFNQLLSFLMYDRITS